ncbi:MAG: carbohydrate ABC transporter permease [Chloroflexi bacterium]|nr:carbohydrate ABC transporter permease [Chloroflexota bacterium]
MTKSRRRHPLHIGRIFTYLLLIGGALISIMPFVYMVMSALKSYGSIIANSFWPWPPFGNEPLQWSNFGQAINDIGFDQQWGIPLFWRYLLNSLIVSGTTVVGSVLISVMAAYAFALMDIPGKNVIFLLFLATLMIPGDLTLVPKVVMMFRLGWYNTYQALIIPWLVSVFGVFLLRQFFMQVPRDLYDAAQLDGAGHLRYLFSIVVPVSRPAIITVALLNFIWSWDNFRWPLLVTRDSNMRVLAVGLQQFMAGEGGTQTHLMMAFASLVVIPVLVFYFFTQKYFTEGITRTGIKG